MNKKAILHVLCGMIEQTRHEIPDFEESKVYKIRMFGENPLITPSALVNSGLAQRYDSNKKHFVPKSLGRVNTKFRGR